MSDKDYRRLGNPVSRQGRPGRALPAAAPSAHQEGTMVGEEHEVKFDSSVSDSELAQRTHAGSLVAFEELVYRYENQIYSFIVNLCRNGTDALEITQETFVKAFQSIEQFDSQQPFAPWLFTI